MLRKIIWSYEGGSNRNCRKLHTEELHHLYSSHFIRAIRSKMGWVGQVERMGEEKYGVSVC